MVATENPHAWGKYNNECIVEKHLNKLVPFNHDAQEGCTISNEYGLFFLSD